LGKNWFVKNALQETFLTKKAPKNRLL